MTQPIDIASAVAQLWPGLSVAECTAWVEWVCTQPNYYVVTIGNSTCITKVYNQSDPPWLRVAHEVAWWGTGRDAVRTFQRGMSWARLQGATHYGYSRMGQLDQVTWRVL